MQPSGCDGRACACGPSCTTWQPLRRACDHGDHERRGCGDDDEPCAYDDAFRFSWLWATCPVNVSPTTRLQVPLSRAARLGPAPGLDARCATEGVACPVVLGLGLLVVGPQSSQLPSAYSSHDTLLVDRSPGGSEYRGSLRPGPGKLQENVFASPTRNGSWRRRSLLAHGTGEAR